MVTAAAAHPVVIACLRVLLEGVISTPYNRRAVEITGSTRLADARWPLWAWCVGAALAIVIGGGLGNWVARRNVGSPQASESQPAATVTPIVEAPAAAPASAAIHRVVPDPEIEIEQPSSVRSAGSPAVRRATPPKQKATPAVPSKKPRCNVYDHMDGC